MENGILIESHVLQNNVSVCGPSYHPRPCGYLWSVLQPQVMLMLEGCAAGHGWVACAAIWGHGDIPVCAAAECHVWVWSRTATWCLVPGLCFQPETMWKLIIHTPAGAWKLFFFFCRDIEDCRHIVEEEGHGRLMWQSLPPPPPRKVTA